MINWTKGDTRVTPNFTVKECLWLPRWNRLHTPTKDEQDNLVRLCKLMEQIRTILGNRTLTIHCMIRPQEYNTLIGGAKKSAHLKGLACDFSIKGEDCDKIRQTLLSHLVRLNCRMEDLPAANWVHVDLAPIMTTRFFKP